MEEEFVYLSTPLSHLVSKGNKRSLGTIFYRCYGAVYTINWRTIMSIKTVGTHCFFIDLKVTPRISSVSCIRPNLLGYHFLFFLAAWVWAFKAAKSSYNLHPLIWIYTWRLESPPEAVWVCRCVCIDMQPCPCSQANWNTQFSSCQWVLDFFLTWWLILGISQSRPFQFLTSVSGLSSP